MARPKGSPNKRSGILKDRLEFMNCDPMKILALTAMNRMECGVCRGELKTKYRLPDGAHTPECRSAGGERCICEGISLRTCQSCWGSGWEACSVKDRKDAAAELLGYIEAKRKAIEHSGVDGEDIGVRLLVEFKE